MLYVCVFCMPGKCNSTFLYFACFVMVWCCLGLAPHNNRAQRFGALCVHGALKARFVIETSRPPTGLRIGIPGSLALRCAAFSKCCATQYQTPRETDSNASWEPFSDLSWPRCVLSWCVSALSSFVQYFADCQAGIRIMTPSPCRFRRSCRGWLASFSSTHLTLPTSSSI